MIRIRYAPAGFPARAETRQARMLLGCCKIFLVGIFNREMCFFGRVSDPEPHRIQSHLGFESGSIF